MSQSREPTLRIETTTVDTGERKEFFEPQSLGITVYFFEAIANQFEKPNLTTCIAAGHG